jgi:putative phosphoesterase
MTRVALISDIHGNAVALEAALGDLAHFGVDDLVCLGDVAAGGPQPCETLARLRELGCRIVLGNADTWLLEGFPSEHEQPEGAADRLATIVDCARSQLSPADIAFLRSFKPSVELELQGASLLCFHGSPRAASERILAETPQKTAETMLTHQSASIYAGGHTHLQLLRRIGASLYLNPGSVGLPLGSLTSSPGSPTLPSWAEYALIESRPGGREIAFRRVAVEVATLVAATAAMPYPSWAVDLERRIERFNAQSRRGSGSSSSPDR